MSIIIREWEDILPEWEFRVFVFNREITSITQYYKMCFVPGMYEKKDDIVAIIRNLFNLVIDNIPEDNFTIDFALSPDLDIEKCWIIEMNEVPPTAGTSLFNWDLEEDRNIIFNGPFEIRILSEPATDIRSQFDPSLMLYICSLRGIDYKIKKSHNHLDYACDECKTFPIAQENPLVWYTCKTCKSCSYDLCKDCYSKKEDIHPIDHEFTKMKSNLQSSSEEEEEGICLTM